MASPTVLHIYSVCYIQIRPYARHYKLYINRKGGKALQLRRNLEPEQDRIKSRQIFFGNNLFSTLSQSVCNQDLQKRHYNLTSFNHLLSPAVTHPEQVSDITTLQIVLLPDRL